MNNMKVAVIGSGSWGTALALKSVMAGNETILYCRTPEMAEAIQHNHENTRYLPGVEIPLTLQTSSDLQFVMTDANIVLMVTPSVYVRSTLATLRPFMKEGMIFVLASKGVERETGKLLTTVMTEELEGSGCHIAVLSGPNHAEEVGRGLPAASSVAAASLDIAEIVQQALHTSDFRIYTNDDLIGIELAAATKNVIALAAGICDGLKLGDNCKALLLTRGLHEMTRFGIALGANKDTYAGLAGMGDLIATCMSHHSRNRAAGEKLAAGESMDYIINHTYMVVEGFFSVSIIYKMATQHNIDMPITQALYQVLYEEKAPSVALHELMNRNSKVESH